MERRISKKMENYLFEMKDKIKDKMTEIGLIHDPTGQQLLQFIMDYEHPTFDKVDFKKKKRSKNPPHLFDRCSAKCANGEQCTRKRKDSVSEFCGTHAKGIPHGKCDADDPPVVQGKKIAVWAQDIHGIMYYIDDMNNVYMTEDILEGKLNPRVIAKYEKCETTQQYSIPAFGV